MNNRNFYILLGVMAIVCGLIFVPQLILPKNKAPEAQMARFPLTIGEWQGTDIPLLERDYAILETKNLIMREYKNNSGESVYLYIIYSGENRKALHPPEICYTGGGTTILEKTVIPLTKNITANEFTIEFKNEKQVVAYWFRAGNYNTANFIKQQLKTMIGRTFGQQTSGAMVRVSAVFLGDNKEKALQAIRSFTGLLEPLLPTYVP